MWASPQVVGFFGYTGDQMRSCRPDRGNATHRGGSSVGDVVERRRPARRPPCADRQYEIAAPLRAGQDARRRVVQRRAAVFQLPPPPNAGHLMIR
jgi:hypothetical protein